MVEHGHGPALVVIPGLPGPWKFAAPAVHALSAHFHVLAVSLGPDRDLDAEAQHIAAALDQRHIDRAVVCGISFGGLIAARFAAAYPKRTAALVLVSTPGPGARLRAHHRLYLRWPLLLGPLFMLETPFRVWRELHWSQITALLSSRISFASMARRARLIESTDIAADCRRIAAPTLVVTGEARLDAVVPVDNTLEYLRAIPGSQHAVIKATGHMGAITRAKEFADIVRTFVERPFQGRGSGPERPALQTREDVA
jgi:pimeloyl-ACP methyl ester carboxylesterase